jgi:hypothetical protein
MNCCPTAGSRKNLNGFAPCHHGGSSSRRVAHSLTLLLGHTKLESTVRYLGIEVDDALEMAEQTEI